MPPTSHRVVHLLLRGPICRVRTVTVLLGGTAAGLVERSPRSHDSPGLTGTLAGTVGGGSRSVELSSGLWRRQVGRGSLRAAESDAAEFRPITHARAQVAISNKVLYVFQSLRKCKSSYSATLFGMGWGHIHFRWFLN